MFEIFAAYLIEKAGLNDKELKLIEELTKPKKLRKRQYLLQEGDISDYRAFIAKGCLRMYRVSNDGTEHIIRFAVENWWITDDESYNSGNPSKYTIDALEDSEVLMLTKENLNALFKLIPKFQDLKERLGAKRFEVSQSRILSNISETAEEKYANFIKYILNFTTGYLCTWLRHIWVYPARPLAASGRSMRDNGLINH